MIRWAVSSRRLLSVPPKMIEVNVNIAPRSITLFIFGLDILMYLPRMHAHRVVYIPVTCQLSYNLDVWLRHGHGCMGPLYKTQPNPTSAQHQAHNCRHIAITIFCRVTGTFSGDVNRTWVTVLHKFVRKLARICIKTWHNIITKFTILISACIFSTNRITQ